MRHERSLAAKMVHGAWASVRNTAWETGVHLLLWVCRAGMGNPNPAVDEEREAKGSVEAYGCARVSISLLLREAELRSVYVRFKLTRLDDGADIRSFRDCGIRSLDERGLRSCELSDVAWDPGADSWGASRGLMGEPRSEKALSKMLSPFTSAGPVMGPCVRLA